MRTGKVVGAGHHGAFVISIINIGIHSGPTVTRPCCYLRTIAVRHSRGDVRSLFAVACSNNEPKIAKTSRSRSLTRNASYLGSFSHVGVRKQPCDSAI